MYAFISLISKDFHHVTIDIRVYLYNSHKQSICSSFLNAIPKLPRGYTFSRRQIKDHLHAFLHTIDPTEPLSVYVAYSRL